MYCGIGASVQTKGIETTVKCKAGSKAICEALEISACDAETAREGIFGLCRLLCRHQEVLCPFLGSAA